MSKLFRVSKIVTSLFFILYRKIDALLFLSGYVSLELDFHYYDYKRDVHLYLLFLQISSQFLDKSLKII